MSLGLLIMLGKKVKINMNNQEMKPQTLINFEEDFNLLLKKYPNLYGTIIINDEISKISASSSFNGSCLVCDNQGLFERIVEYNIQHTAPRNKN